ncbi:MAG: FHA domain-containing protein [Planctomycetes bacterium]|nr:FHA domain-containing protein [Planctomycetota bacterium]
MDVKLVMFKADGQKKEFSVPGPSAIIGRGEDCDLRVPILSVSRHHCEVTLYEDGVGVKDLGSSNGTFINNTKITEAGVEAGDLLAIGPIVFIVQIDGVPENITPKMVRGKSPGIPAKDQKADSVEAVELEPQGMTEEQTIQDEGGFPLGSESGDGQPPADDGGFPLNEPGEEAIGEPAGEFPLGGGEQQTGGEDPISALEMLASDTDDEPKKKKKK